MRGLPDAGRDSTVRAAEKCDLADVRSIYADEVLHGSASFELEPPTLEEITARWASVLSFQLPYLVAIKDDRIAGYAYVLPYRPRPAYRYTVENSIYVDPGHGRLGLGGLLIEDLADRCAALGYRQMIAVIGGALMMKLAFNDNFNYTGTYAPAMKYGFLAGCLGALGALFLTFALTKAGGKPAYVMPIVFGGAVSVNAIAAFLSLNQGESVSPLMWVGMLFVAIGIVLTAGNTPHGHPPAKPATASADTTAEAAVEESPSPGLEDHSAPPAT